MHHGIKIGELVICSKAHFNLGPCQGFARAQSLACEGSLQVEGEQWQIGLPSSQVEGELQSCFPSNVVRARRLKTKKSAEVNVQTARRGLPAQFDYSNNL